MSKFWGQFVRDLIIRQQIQQQQIQHQPYFGIEWVSYQRLLLLGIGLLCLSACTQSGAESSNNANNPKGGGKKPVPVVVGQATSETVPILQRSTGTVQAYSTVSVKSQIPGQLIRVHFQEGQEVRKGDRLFTIDPRPLHAALDQALASRAKAIAQVNQAEAALQQAQAQVNQAKANLAKDSSLAKNAEAQAQRYSRLLAEGAVSRDQAEQFRTNAASQNAVMAADRSSIQNAIAAVTAARANVEDAKAGVRAADAAIDSAKVQLSYSNISAPINGRTGNLQVNQGNLVKENDSTPLVVISQIRPIFTTFSIPQRLLPELKKHQAQGNLRVAVVPTEGKGRKAQGEVVFVDSVVDATTGTLQLKAKFPNTEGQLTPGQFVNVELQLAQESNAIVVPTQAVQIGQKGPFVYVVKPNKTVALKSVTPGATVGTQTVIKQGLQSGDRVVIDGQFSLSPGAKIREQPGSKPQSRSQPNPKGSE